MGNQISNELVSSSLGVDFISRVLDQGSRCQMARSSTGLWMAVESARDGGACIAWRLVRARMDRGSKMGHAEERDGLSGEWRAIAEPTSDAFRESYGCAAVGSLVYVLGGLDATWKYLDSVEVLDTVSGTWITAAPLPTPRSMPQCAVVGSLLYMIGGYDDSYRHTGSVEVLDTVTATWSTAVQPLPTPRTEHRCAVVGSLVYVIGGIRANGWEHTDSVEVLDTVSGTWSAEPLPTPRRNHHCAVVGSLVYVIGGIDSSNTTVRRLDSVEVLDTVTGTWSTLEPGAPLPSHVPTQQGEVLCEYKEQPCARYMSGEVRSTRSARSL